jgi:hypothetical protein
VDEAIHPEAFTRGTLLEALEGLPPNFTVPIEDLMPISGDDDVDDENSARSAPKGA